MRRIILIVLCTLLASCVGLSNEASEDLGKLLDTAKELGGTVEQIADEFTTEFRNACDVSERKVTEAQQTLAAACEGIADAEKKRRCQDFNRRQKELINRIREECEAGGQ